MYNKAGVDYMEKYDKDVTIKTFSERLKKVRELKGLSEQWVADLANISVEEYSQIEKGNLPTNSLSLVINIAYIIDINMDYLLGFSDDPLPSNQNALLNKYDVNDPEQKIQREILHLITLLDDEKKEEALTIIKEFNESRKNRDNS